VVCEAFSALSDPERRKTERFLEHFEESWCKYDQKASGTILPKELPLLIRTLPAPYGVPYSNTQHSFRMLSIKLRWLERQPGFTYQFNQVLEGVVALGLTQIGEYKSLHFVDKLKLFSAAHVIFTKMRLWRERSQKPRVSFATDVHENKSS
jgi:DNA-binding transcriptional ArsR family regulator